MKVTLIASTMFRPDTASELTGGVWVPELDGLDDVGQSSYLSEFAGRACYQSWGKPNPATATNMSYLAHILDVHHMSVLQHGGASFYIEGVSRGWSHEAVRHHHLSPSQLSQRYVNAGRVLIREGLGYAVPPLFEGDDLAEEILDLVDDQTMEAYNALVERAEVLLTRKFGDGLSATMRKKRACEAARAVLPNMTETKMVLSGNHLAWLEFLEKRTTEGPIIEGPADLEMQRVACEIYRQLNELEPAIYQGLNVTPWELP